MTRKQIVLLPLIGFLTLAAACGVDDPASTNLVHTDPRKGWTEVFLDDGPNPVHDVQKRCDGTTEVYILIYGGSQAGISVVPNSPECH